MHSQQEEICRTVHVSFCSTKLGHISDDDAQGYLCQDWSITHNTEWKIRERKRIYGINRQNRK